MNLNISELVKRFGSYRLEKGGDELVFKCPKCGRRKFYVNPAKLKSHCVVCSWVVRFPRQVKKLLTPKRVVEEVEDKPVEMPPLCYQLESKEVAFLQSRGVPQQTWVGWSACRKFPNRIIIPIVENGKIMSWVARAVDGQKPKEISGPNRNNFLYGYDHVGKLYSMEYLGIPVPIILVEGIFDQIKISAYGEACLALMGSSISDVQVGKIIRWCPPKIILMMDGDDAGRKATEKIANRLGKRMNPMQIAKVYLSEGKDPDELTWEEFQKLMEGI